MGAPPLRYRHHLLAVELTDRNLIETVWCWMKDWIELYSGFNANLTYPQSNRLVQQAWEAVPVKLLDELIDSMHKITLNKPNHYATRGLTPRTGPISRRPHHKVLELRTHRPVR